MTELKVEYNSEGVFGLLKKPFKQLERLDLYVPNDFYHHFGGFVRNNTQIKKMRIFEMSQEFVDEIGSNLANLEDLSVELVNVVNEARFENVKHLEIRQFTNQPMDQLSFPRLETLKVAFTDNYKVELFGRALIMWMNFLQRHPNITFEM